MSGKVASYKFLPLIYQLAARMSNSNDHFQRALQQVSYTTQVTYHTLQYLLIRFVVAIKNFTGPSLPHS